jgi:amidase/aspartyl-tRNA(Asn)/glutamyl-tRNA(Gln) amidotransferase subunit A
MAFALTDQEEKEAHSVQLAWQQELSGYLTQNAVLFLPTTPTTAPKLNTDISNLRTQIMSLSAIAGLAKTPQVHLPLLNYQSAKINQVQPYGFSLLMAQHQDLNLLNTADKLSRLSSWSQ